MRENRKEQEKAQANYFQHIAKVSFKRSPCILTGRVVCRGKRGANGDRSITGLKVVDL